MLLLLIACGPGGPAELSVQRREGGLEVVADRPLVELSVWTEAGQPVTRRVLPSPTEQASVPVSLPVGARWRVQAIFEGGESAQQEILGPALPVELALEAPVGQGSRPLSDGERASVWALPQARAAIVLTALTADSPPVTVDDGSLRQDVALGARGERALVPVPLDRQREITVTVGDESLSFVLDPRPLDLKTARQQLELRGTWMPADPTGKSDVTLPSDRLVAPMPWVQALGLGWRPDPAQAPFTWQAVALHNASEHPIDVVLRGQITDERGEPAPAFRSRLRDQEGQPYVTALLRVPAGGEATGALPVWLDPGALPGSGGRFVRELEVIPLGASEPLHEVSAPLYVARGTGSAGAFFALASALSLAGWAGLMGTARSFLRSTSTADLVTIAMFTATAFAVGATLQVVGLLFSALLGPFAPFVMGLPDDAFRAVLLAALLTLLPRPGVLAAATAIGFVMRGLVLGSFHPVDLLYVGTVISTHELALWLSGITRSDRWREAPAWSRWLRLCLGLALPNAICTGLGLATTAILYRLWYAPWYVAALIGLPGFLYVAIGCWIAMPIALSLRRISR